MENSTSYQEWNTWLFPTIHWPYFCTVAVASEYSTAYLWCLRCYGLLVHPWRLFMGWKTQESRGDGFKGGQIIVSLMHMSVGFSHRRLQCLVRAYGTKKFMAFIAWVQRRPWLHQILMWPETCSATLTSQTNMILNNPLSYWCLERRWDLQPLPINFFQEIPSWKYWNCFYGETESITIRNSEAPKSQNGGKVHLESPTITIGRKCHRPAKHQLLRGLFARSVCKVRGAEQGSGQLRMWCNHGWWRAQVKRHKILGAAVSKVAHSCP